MTKTKDIEEERKKNAYKPATLIDDIYQESKLKEKKSGANI